MLESNIQDPKASDWPLCSHPVHGSMVITGAAAALKQNVGPNKEERKCNKVVKL